MIQTKITINIPKEFEEHFNSDRFKDSLLRLCCDANCLAGNYEKETAIMLIIALENAEIEGGGELMDDLISRKDAIDVALTFFVEFLGGAFHEDDQRKLIALYEQLPSAVRPKTTIDVHNELIGYDSFRE